MTTEEIGLDAPVAFDEAALNALYADISAPQGVEIAQLVQRLEERVLRR